MIDYKGPFRLIKPKWGTPKLRNGENNPDFKKEVDGDNIEGYFTQEQLEKKNRDVKFRVFSIFYNYRDI